MPAFLLVSLNVRVSKLPKKRHGSSEQSLLESRPSLCFQLTSSLERWQHFASSSVHSPLVLSHSFSHPPSASTLSTFFFSPSHPIDTPDSYTFHTPFPWPRPSLPFAQWDKLLALTLVSMRSSIETKKQGTEGRKRVLEDTRRMAARRG